MFIPKKYFQRIFSKRSRNFELTSLKNYFRMKLSKLALLPDLMKVAKFYLLPDQYLESEVKFSYMTKYNEYYSYSDINFENIWMDLLYSYFW